MRLLLAGVLLLGLLPSAARADIENVADEILAPGEWVAYRVRVPEDGLLMAWRDFAAGTGLSGGGVISYTDNTKPRGGCFVAADQETRVSYSTDVGAGTVYRGPGLYDTEDGCGVSAETGGDNIVIAFVVGDGATQRVRLEGPEGSQLIRRTAGTGTILRSLPEFQTRNAVDAGATLGNWQASSYVVGEAKTEVTLADDFFGAFFGNGRTGTLRYDGPAGSGEGSDVFLGGVPGGNYSFSGTNVTCATADTESSSTDRCVLAVVGASIVLP